MREDIYEPLSRYRDEFKEKFFRLTAEKFDELTRISAVDLQENAVLVGNIKKLAAIKEKTENSRSLYCVLNILFAILAAGGILCIILAFYDPEAFSGNHITAAAVSAVTSGVSLLLFFSWSLPAYRHADGKIRELEELISKKTAEAWSQMAPLNKLFTWNITAELIEKTVPRIEFDPFFTEARLQDLRESFGWDDSLNDNRSVLNSHSGVINDNPFVFAELLRQDWQEKRYTGYLEISWWETVRDSDGKSRSVRRTQTLTAHVDKPVPVYLTDKVLIYGNEAAPELDFSRAPSDLSGEDDNLWNSIKRAHRLGKLKKFARNLDDDSNFTMMSNEEFELLFHAKDRNDEVGFRILFTPLAQQQMVELLNDKTVGFGDDFHFIKDNMINIIIAEHLNKVNFSHDPERFKGYDYQEIKNFFIQYNTEFFKSAYFALAPLLTIPLYQQTRTRSAIYGEQEKHQSCFWEHEALANYCGDSCFEHPECITQNLLKTRCTGFDTAGNAEIEVTAHGFCGEQRIDYVSVFGGDGRLHDVPVEWIEYLPVARTSFFNIMDTTETENTSETYGALYRRGIFAWLPER